jgi:hypothetical protein
MKQSLLIKLRLRIPILDSIVLRPSPKRPTQGFLIVVMAMGNDPGSMIPKIFKNRMYCLSVFQKVFFKKILFGSCCNRNTCRLPVHPVAY